MIRLRNIALIVCLLMAGTTVAVAVGWLGGVVFNGAIGVH